MIQRQLQILHSTLHPEPGIYSTHQIPGLWLLIVLLLAFSQTWHHLPHCQS